MATLRQLMSLAMAAVLVKLGMAANYIVGGPNGGWDAATNLQSWASSQSFTVGDNLIFQYPPKHDVLEVSKVDYDSCQASNPLQAYNDGNTVIPLSSPGKRYFICGTLGHCSIGMKLEIDTAVTSAAAPASSPTNPLPEASPSSQPPLLVTPPFFSLVPEVSNSSPAKSPEYAPAVSSPSPSHLPVRSPGVLPVVSSTESRTTSLSPSGFSTESLPSSAKRDGLHTNLATGLGLVMVMLLAP